MHLKLLLRLLLRFCQRQLSFGMPDSSQKGEARQQQQLLLLLELRSLRMNLMLRDKQVWTLETRWSA
ncbi:hypothetical protein PR202_gb15199 [Eleusine coracana subsp. coracana]|uniref:Secreted protein n=1 Tax=Eleusine coracana subsp. coracana TaxID=191504 RepID=A0AAV5EWZ4_ELECO|nr:hypothetical protein PR202_gb15199 [Eleusine coracana subsp. coracana]